ncbi:MAG: transcription elongation factor GreA [Patescibacteria group bacterium]|nr:transcription elongation factor GreA [Patescibacteria group bacterium]
MESDKEYLTKEKYRELVDELDWLQTGRRKEVADELREATSLGDLSENAEYHQAREDQAGVEKRIKELEVIIKNAVIVKQSKFNTVSAGATVVVKKKGDKESKEFYIVGTQEADIDQNKISVTSPLVNAMLDKKEGETFTFKSPKGMQEYKIISVK